jgi:hypothetical protein
MACGGEEEEEAGVAGPLWSSGCMLAMGNQASSAPGSRGSGCGGGVTTVGGATGGVSGAEAVMAAAAGAGGAVVAAFTPCTGAAASMGVMAVAEFAVRTGAAAVVVWTSLGPLPRWVPGPTTRWAPGTTRLVPHDT